MPYYEYACPACGALTVEVFGIEEAPESVEKDWACPEGDGYPPHVFERILSAPHVNVKGGTPKHHRRG